MLNVFSIYRDLVGFDLSYDELKHLCKEAQKEDPNQQRSLGENYSIEKLTQLFLPSES